MNFGTARFHFLIFSKGLHVLTFKKNHTAEKPSSFFLFPGFKNFLRLSL